MGRRARLVLYDEGCGFCAATAEVLARRGIETAPIGSRVGDVWLRDLSRAERYAAFHAVDGLGRRRSGSEAVPLVLAALPAGRVLAALSRGLPSATALGYALVARNRGLLSRLLRAGLGGAEA